jgi:hypothetical protein
MRFMIIVKASRDSEAGVMPEEPLIAAMAKYHEDLTKAGVLLDANGLHPSAKGARIRFSRGKRSVVDGPFAAPQELIAGFTFIQVKSKEEAVEWAKRMPSPQGENNDCEVEVRQLFELEDFGPSEAIERFRDIGVAVQK